MPSTTRPTRGASHTWLTTVTVDDIDLGIFQTLSALETTADVQKDKPGGMAPSIAYPAPAEHGDMTAGRPFELERDGLWVPWLRGRVGLGFVAVQRIILGSDGVVSTKKGAKTLFTGLLSGFTDWEVDANGTDPSKFEITFGVEDVQ